MKISFKGDYAIKSLLYLALKSEDQRGAYFQLGEISYTQDVPEKFLEQILLILKKSGYLTSQRGANGGFALNRDPATINLGEIIRLIDGPLAPIACIRENAHRGCDFKNKCVLKPIWEKVHTAVCNIVDNITFKDLIEKERELERNSAQHLMYYI